MWDVVLQNCVEMVLDDHKNNGSEAVFHLLQRLPCTCTALRDVGRQLHELKYVQAFLFSRIIFHHRRLWEGVPSSIDLDFEADQGFGTLATTTNCRAVKAVRGRFFTVTFVRGYFAGACPASEDVGWGSIFNSNRDYANAHSGLHATVGRLPPEIATYVALLRWQHTIFRGVLSHQVVPCGRRGCPRPAHTNDLVDDSLGAIRALGGIHKAYWTGCIAMVHGNVPHLNTPFCCGHCAALVRAELGSCLPCTDKELEPEVGMPARRRRKPPKGRQAAAASASASSANDGIVCPDCGDPTPKTEGGVAKPCATCFVRTTPGELYKAAMDRNQVLYRRIRAQGTLGDGVHYRGNLDEYVKILVDVLNLDTGGLYAVAIVDGLPAYRKQRMLVPKQHDFRDLFPFQRVPMSVSEIYRTYRQKGPLPLVTRSVEPAWMKKIKQEFT